MADSKYSIGIHEYAFNDAPVNTYATGELEAYLDELGLADAGGAIAHVKLNDDNGLWSTGAIPSVSPSKALFLSEAKALGFTTLLAWQTGGPPGETAGPWTDTGQTYLDPEFDAAAVLIAAIPNVDIFLWGNEREADEISNTAADETYRLRYFALETRAGAIWQALGKPWCVGADQSTANFLGALDERQAAWTAAGLTPDYISLHFYGSGGAMPQHLGIVRDSIEYRTGRTWSDQVIVSEWAVSFENLTSYDTKDHVRDFKSRDFAEHWGRALRQARWFGCYFTFKEIYRPYEGIDPYDGVAPEDTPRFPLQGIIDSLSDAEVNAMPPSAYPTDEGLNTRRFLIEGRWANRVWNASLRALRDRARSLVTYFGYWT